MRMIISLVLVTTMATSAHAQHCCSPGGMRTTSRPGGYYPPRFTGVYPTPYWPVGRVPVLATPTWSTSLWATPISTTSMPQQPLMTPQNVTNPIRTTTTANPIAKTSSSADSFNSRVHDPDRYLIRTSDEKDSYVRDMIRRAREAEQEGNYGLARVRYFNAYYVHPDAAGTDQARAAYDRIKNR